MHYFCKRSELVWYFVEFCDAGSSKSGGVKLLADEEVECSGVLRS